MGARVTLSGAGAAVTFTNVSGNYTFSGLKEGSYSVAITKPDFSCLPRSSSVRISGGDVAGLNFSAAVSPPVFYVIDDHNQLATVDVETRTVTVIGDTQVFLNDIAFDRSGNLFGVSGDQLYRVDPATAATTLIGPLGAQEITSLGSGADGRFFLANSTLYTVDTSTGSATLIGRGGDGYQSSGDLTFFGDRLYLTSAYNAAGNALVRLDPTTGAGAFVGPIGFTDVYGLATNDNVTLYGFSGTKVITIDPATGAGTLLFDLSSSGVWKLNGAAMR